MIKNILDTFPSLNGLHQASTLGSYIAPAMQWQRKADIFPHSETLVSILKSETARLYGTDLADQLAEQLSSQAYTAETGPHLHLPRDFDKATRATAGFENTNTLVTQSILGTTALYHQHQLPIKLSLYTGIIPPSNVNSASYLQVTPDGTNLARILSNKISNCVQAYLPAMNNEKIDEVSKSLKNLNENETARKNSLIHLFHNNEQSFSDQILVASNSLYDELQQNSGVKQVTLDQQNIAVKYMIALLQDETSVISQIFQTDQSGRAFAKRFAGIGTGWRFDDERQETPFVSLKPQSFVWVDAPNKKSDAAAETVGYKPDGTYTGSCDRLSLLEGLTNKTIMPTGAMGYIATIMDGGMLSVGGMFQSEYCTQIRDRSVALLSDLGYGERAEALAQMPTHIAVVSPVWAIEANDNPDLLNYGAFLKRGPLPTEIWTKIPDVTGESALYGAIPCLGHLSHQPVDTQEWKKGLPNYNILAL